MIPMVHKIEILRRNPSTSATRPRMIIVPLPVVDHCVLQECPHGGWFNRIHRQLRNSLLNQACARRCRCPAPRLRRPAGVGPAAAVPRGHSGPAADPGSCTPRGPSTAGPTSSVPTTTRPSATASTRRRSGPLHQRRSAISVVFSARTTGSPVRGERGILGEGCRDCYRPVRRRSQSSTVARVDASAVPRRRCSRRCAMDRRYSGMANDGRSRPPPATRMWWANPRSRVVIGTTRTSPTGQALNALVETTRTGRVPLCSPGPAGSRDASQTSPRSGIQTLDRCFLPLATLGEVVAPCLGVHLAQLAHLSGGLLHQCRVLYLARQLIEQCTHRDAANLSGGGEAVPHLDGYLDGGQIGHPKKVPHQGVHSEGRMSATGAGRRRCRWAAAVVGAGKCRHSALTHDAEAGNQHTDAAGPLPACLDAVAGALRPSRARGAGPPRRGRRSRCPPAPTLTTVASIASGEDGAVPEDDVPTGDVVSEPAASPGVYRLRAVLHAVSPLIWRRLLVSGESTVADLHIICLLYTSPSPRD